MDEELIAQLMNKIKEVGHVPMPGGYPDSRAWTMDCRSFRAAPTGAARSFVCLALLGKDDAMGRRSTLRPRWTLHADLWLDSNAEGLGTNKKFAGAKRRRYLLEAMFRIVARALPKGADASQFRAAKVLNWKDRAANRPLKYQSTPLVVSARMARLIDEK